MWLKLYDPGRTPAHWSEIIRKGEYCAFILDAAQRAPRDFNGQTFSGHEASVEIAADFEAAVVFAQQIVLRHPELCCEIYGHEGKVGEPLRTVYEQSARGKYEGLQFAYRGVLRGLALICVALVFIVYDVSRHLQWIWGYIIGLKLFVIGGVFLVRGIAGLWEHRAERKLPGSEHPSRDIGQPAENSNPGDAIEHPLARRQLESVRTWDRQP